ncbi:MAG: hypothetical protein OXN17_11655 [Candidatus Poribacteria bacterium]|nr:hypothetical protein [Candidatus Poribacteria bacterium]MDE0505604.1 hypothetical protein [Candidatus Poribacteria bacterium]
MKMPQKLSPIRIGTILVLAATIATTTSITADTEERAVIYRKDGSVDVGKIIKKLANESVSIQTLDGKELIRPVADILGIQKLSVSTIADEKVVIYLKDGSKIIGTMVKQARDQSPDFTSSTKESIEIRTAQGHHLVYAQEEIMEVERLWVSAIADAKAVLHLRSGSKIIGTIVKELPDRIEIRTTEGNQLVYSMDRVLEIERLWVPTEADSTVVVQLKNGSRIIGRIIREIPDECLWLRTSDGSQLVYSYDDIRHIKRHAPPPEPTVVVYLTNGSKLLGTIIKESPDRSIEIRMTDGNQLVYRRDQILEIERLIVPDRDTHSFDLPSRKPTNVNLTHTTETPVYPPKRNPPLFALSGEKNPGLAVGLSFLMPGLGQAYNEQYADGVGFFLLHTASWTTFVVGTALEEDGVALGGLGAAIVFSIGSAIHAGVSANRINRELHGATSGRRFGFNPVTGKNRFGAIVRLRF